VRAGCLEIAGPPVDRAAFLSETFGGMRRFAPGEILAACDMGILRDQAVELGRRLDTLLLELDGAQPDFATAYARFKSFVAEMGDWCGHTESFISGTLNALPRIGMFYGFRISDPAARERLYRRYIEEVRGISREMTERLCGLMADLVRLVEPGTAAAE
jgi:hypothetical protein